MRLIDRIHRLLFRHTRLDPRGTDDNRFRKAQLTRWQWLDADGMWCRYQLDWNTNIRYWTDREQARKYPPKDGVVLVRIDKRWVIEANERARREALIRTAAEKGLSGPALHNFMRYGTLPEDV